jgi:hypothetical protein
MSLVLLLVNGRHIREKRPKLTRKMDDASTERFLDARA